jgi:nucleotide-binding universal stress UspA family protein
VPIFGTDVSARALRQAAKLAGDEAAVDAVYVIEVPSQLSLESGMEKEEELGRNVLEAARLGARSGRLKIRTSIIRTRHAGAALVDEARGRGSEVIYLDTVHAPSHERALGPTARYLLEKRPCRIIIEIDGGLGKRTAGVVAPRG